MAGLDYRSAEQLVDALRTRQVSALEVVNHAIARIEALDERINAVVVRDFEQARIAAKVADKALAKGEQRPLLGLPLTVKEAFNIAGLPTTWGLTHAKDLRASEDAVIVQRAKAAGAIILGKTNVPVLLADWQSYNDIYGTTKNPWDLSRTPGGSSGGSAASLAGGYVPLEVGSDLGGSLRVPAHFCGVYAHKPTHGLVPQRGHTPPGVPPLPIDIDLAVVGPMARSAADLALLFDVIAGPDESNAMGYRLALPASRHDRLAGFRALVLDAHPLLPTGQAVSGAIERFAAQLAKVGCSIARSSPLLPDLGVSARLYMQLLTAFQPGADMPIEDYRRIRELVAAMPQEDVSLATMRLRGTVMSHREWIGADRVRADIRRQWRELFSAFDVVVCPIMPTPAFPHNLGPRRERQIDIDGKLHPYDDQLVWPGVATMPGLPSTAAPIDRSASGLPIGIQIIGPYLEDRTTLTFARLIEVEFGGFTIPTALQAAK